MNEFDNNPMKEGDNRPTDQDSGEKGKNISREQALQSDVDNPSLPENLRQQAREELARLQTVDETGSLPSQEYSNEYQKVLDAREDVLSGRLTEQEGNEVVTSAYDRMAEIRRAEEENRLPFDELPSDTPADIDGEPITNFGEDSVEESYGEYMARLEDEEGVSRRSRQRSDKNITSGNEREGGPNQIEFTRKTLLEKLQGLPEHEQLKLVREKLNSIDSVDASTSMEFGTANDARELDVVKESNVVSKEIAMEIEARLALHDCGVLMRRADGKINIKRKEGELDPVDKTTIPRAVQTVYGNDRQINGERLRTILEKGKMKDFEVGYAWDILQKINFERDDSGNYTGYAEWIERANREDGTNFPTNPTQWVENEQSFGDTNTNFTKDNKTDRHEAVKRAIIKEIASQIELTDSRKEELNISSEDEEAKYKERIALQSFKMAEKTVWATLESSNLNRELNIGPDQLAECIGFKFARKAALRKNQLAGPLIHVDRVEGFGGSYLRSFLNKGNEEPLYVSDIRSAGYEKLDPGSYQTYAARTLAFDNMRELLLDRNTDKTKLLDSSLEWYRKVNGTIIRTDPNAFKEGSLDLEFWLIIGILDVELNAEGVRDNKDLWTSAEIERFKNRCLEPINPNDPSTSFLTEKQWNNIALAIGYTGIPKTKENFVRGFVRGFLGKQQ